MTTATMSSKGQVTIPLDLRQALGLHAGVRLDFVREGDVLKVVKLADATSALKGRFAGRVALAPSVADMDEAIAQELASSHAAGAHP
ncbi:AbrB/MazE/SpoVT family DNA-binding domain-containing protein [Rhodoferax sp.]|uniref:AbrB/MazE/SpoVT family DNA-binding domain-containing protein n=1 Tax=Rhodoferax sp. TaxID=50421 RepID=UPI002636E7A1|nr:AbrB/MazE/SpoVT family DNA-binding domain-containing protein [Rhodoferax sp.]MDD2924589.1 AbrB/MazE/SpoVT family DNA-binding domain-containing protein [Rhodoferax sp.]